jgi:hypothetical protein
MGSDSDSTSHLACTLVDATLSAARNRDTNAARQLLQWIIDGLRTHRELPPEWADFLVDALTQALANPKHAGAALGLIAKRKRPQLASKWKNERELVIAVTLLKRKGVPLKGTRGNSGAFALVADQCHTSVRTVERAWDAGKVMQRTLRKVGTKSED